MYPPILGCGAFLFGVRVYCKSGYCFFCYSLVNIFLKNVKNRVNIFGRRTADGSRANNFMDAIKQMFDFLYKV